MGSDIDGSPHMAKEESIGSLFGKAKKWAKQELKSATRIGGDPVQQCHEDEQNKWLGREIRDDAEQMRDDAIIDAITPQSLKDYQAMTAANKAQRDAETQAAARAKRLSLAGDSRVELSGYVTGVAEGLAVSVFLSEDGATLFGSVECVDPVPMDGGTLAGFQFAIPGYVGDGTYTLVDRPDFDGLQYELFLTDEDDSGWGYLPSFGPGVIVVQDSVADVRLVLGSIGTETIDLHATIQLSS
jgi:hypothetical protein